MHNFSFHTGQPLILRSVEYVIQRIHQNRNVVLERCSDLTLVQCTSQELADAFGTGELEFIAPKCLSHNGQRSPSSKLRCLDSFSEEEQQEAQRRKSYVMLAIEELGNQPCRSSLDHWVEVFAARLADPKPPSPISLYRWWRTWEESGGDVVSLVARKGGRVSQYMKQYSSLIHEVIDELLMRPEYGTRQDAYDLFRSRIIGLNMHSHSSADVPSRATFYRFLKKNIDPYTLCKAQEGKNAADMKFRVSGQGVKTTRILERVEIDHTPIDLMVFDERIGGAVGRPTLTMILDHHSRMPLGFYLGFEPPSAVAVMRAIRHAILPKSYVKEDYPEFKNEWPTYGIFWKLVCDNGSEFHDHQLKRIAHELNIELFFCPKKHPYYKGAVERFLGTLNRAVCHDVSGTTRSNIQQRKGYDSVAEAHVTLEQLRRSIHDWIINVYSVSYHEGLAESPLNVWLKGREQVEPTLPVSRERLDLVLTKEFLRKINHEGVCLKRLKYNSYELGLLRRQLPRGAYVKVRVDPEDLGKVWVFDDSEGSFFAVPCSDPEYAQNLSARQHAYILKSRQDRRKSLDTDELLEAKIHVKQEIQKAAKAKGLRKRTKAAQLSQNNQLEQAVPPHAERASCDN